MVRGQPPLTPVPETPWRGAWGPEAATAPSAAHGRQGPVVDKKALTGAILDVMKGEWDLPADCNEGELYTYAEQLCDRLRAGESRDALYGFLADIQAKTLEMPASDAYRAIVDQAVALAGTAG